MSNHLDDDFQTVPKPKQEHTLKWTAEGSLQKENEPYCLRRVKLIHFSVAFTLGVGGSGKLSGRHPSMGSSRFHLSAAARQIESGGIPIQDTGGWENIASLPCRWRIVRSRTKLDFVRRGDKDLSSTATFGPKRLTSNGGGWEWISEVV